MHFNGYVFRPQAQGASHGRCISAWRCQKRCHFVRHTQPVRGVVQVRVTPLGRPIEEHEDAEEAEEAERTECKKLYERILYTRPLLPLLPLRLISVARRLRASVTLPWLFLNHAPNSTPRDGTRGLWGGIIHHTPSFAKPPNTALSAQSAPRLPETPSRRHVACPARPLHDTAVHFAGCAVESPTRTVRDNILFDRILRLSSPFAVQQYALGVSYCPRLGHTGPDDRLSHLLYMTVPSTTVTYTPFLCLIAHSRNYLRSRQFVAGGIGAGVLLGTWTYMENKAPGFHPGGYLRTHPGGYSQPSRTLSARSGLRNARRTECPPNRTPRDGTRGLWALLRPDRDTK